MKGSKINLSSLKFISITECTIIKDMNNHGSAKVSGIIDESDEKEIMSIITDEDMQQIILTDDKDKEIVLFTGIIESARIDVEGELYIASVKLAGGTKMLDVIEKTRTFQDKYMTYEQLLKVLDNECDDADHCSGSESDNSIGDIIVQYQETDWEFIKRMASHFNTCIYPYFLRTGSRYYFGIQDSYEAKTIDAIRYSIENCKDEYKFKIANGVSNLIEEDALVYHVESREIYELGESVIFKDKKLFVAKLEAKFIEAELIYRYHLKTKNGISEIKTYNKKIIGASLEGHIIDVSNDRVKAHMEADEAQDLGGAKWFKYSTVYSSPDGTGWYCMPEPNDRVRLYFPNEKEEDAYIISSIHESVNSDNSQGARTNPDNKSLSTKYGKQVEMTPTTITMTNNKGMMIKIDDGSGISIISDKDIVFESQGAITIASIEDTMSINAIESIELVQGNAKMTMKGDVTIEGAKFKMQ